MRPAGTVRVPAAYVDRLVADQTVQVTKWVYYEYDSVRCPYCDYYVFHPWNVNIMDVQGYTED
jgi:hypothetical protein